MDTDLSGYPTVFDPNTLVRKGLCPVTDIKGETSLIENHSLYYEQHGTGPEKVLLIMGLNASCFGWQPQVDYLGSKDKYSVLVYDNRGVGNSGTPKGPYSTSEMADDAILLLKLLGWTEERDLHVVGISMGGMIAQELATRIPERIISLTLCVSTAGGWIWQNQPPWAGFKALAHLLFVTDPAVKVPIILDMCFSQTWLNSKDPHDPKGRTVREVQTEKYLKRIEITRLQSPIGALSQMWAGSTHHVKKSRLHDIGTGIPKVAIVTGTDDNLVLPSKSKYLAKHIPGAEYIEWPGAGHVINVERKEEFCKLLDRVVDEGRKRVD